MCAYMLDARGSRLTGGFILRSSADIVDIRLMSITAGCRSARSHLTLSAVTHLPALCRKRLFSAEPNINMEGIPMRKRNRWIVLILVLLILGMAALYRHRALLPSPLLKNAIKITAVQDLLSYYWLSSNQLLVKTSTNGLPNIHSPWSGYLEGHRYESRGRAHVRRG